MNRVLINAIFPGEPVAYKRVAGFGRRAFVPAVMRNWQKKLRRDLKMIAPKLQSSNKRFGVQVVFYLAPCHTRHEQDGDNLEKLLWDAFIGKIWNDDSQIIEWQGKKVLNDPKPRTHLVVYTIE